MWWRNSERLGERERELYFKIEQVAPETKVEWVLLLYLYTDPKNVCPYLFFIPYVTNSSKTNHILLIQKEFLLVQWSFGPGLGPNILICNQDQAQNTIFYIYYAMPKLLFFFSL